MDTLSQVRPGRTRCRVAPAALALLQSARQGLAEAGEEGNAGSRYVAAHLAALLAKATRTGERYRLQVLEQELYAAIEQLRAAGARILSVAPVRATLEEFFMDLVEADRAQAPGPDHGGDKTRLRRAGGVRSIYRQPCSHLRRLEVEAGRFSSDADSEPDDAAARVHSGRNLLGFRFQDTHPVSVRDRAYWLSRDGYG